jgi:hypothetical protein
MKQQSNPSFEKASLEALGRARQFNDVPKIMEAVSRAAMLIAMSPEKVEDVFREKMQKGVKI